MKCTAISQLSFQCELVSDLSYQSESVSDLSFQRESWSQTCLTVSGWISLRLVLSVWIIVSDLSSSLNHSVRPVLSKWISHRLVIISVRITVSDLSFSVYCLLQFQSSLKAITPYHLHATSELLFKTVIVPSPYDLDWTLVLPISGILLWSVHNNCNMDI